MPSRPVILDVDCKKFNVKRDNETITSFVSERLSHLAPNDLKCKVQAGPSHETLPASVTLPSGIIDSNFKPRQGVKLLTNVKSVPKPIKFIGHEQVSKRQTDFSLKLFNNNHFYLKQALVDGSPWWTFYEGKYTQSGPTITMDYYLKYTCSDSPSDDACNRIEVVKHSSTLTFNQSEKELSGKIVASVGTDEFAWTNLVRTNDTITSSKSDMIWNTRTTSSDEESVDENEDKVEQTQENNISTDFLDNESEEYGWQFWLGLILILILLVGYAYAIIRYLWLEIGGSAEGQIEDLLKTTQFKRTGGSNNFKMPGEL